MQHALAVRIAVLAILVVSAGLGATSYLGSRDKARDAAAQAHVRAAVNAALAWFQDPYGGRGSYRRLSSRTLAHEAPAVSRNVGVTVLAGGRAYCLHDVEGSGHSAYYLGGDTHLLTDLAGATPYQVTLVRSTALDAATVCARMS
jgi:hypothetical protein